MIRHQKRRKYPRARPLSNWAIALGAVIVLAIAVTAWIVLLRRYGGAGASVELDAIRTAGALVVGTGGAFALLLAARRQRSTELTLVHTEHDATERRITELYTKAADQLGSDQAPVRLAGLYALERLAHSTVEHRQTIVDVICAYLRMPYTPPPETPQVGTYYGDRDHGAADSPSSTITTPQSVATPTDQHQQSRQEREVRLTAQGILARNLRLPDLPDESRRRRWAPWRGAYREPSWPGIRLNLDRALLLDVSLESCWIAEADFFGTQFIGLTDFNGARFTGGANFEGARFTGMAYFAGARFTGETYFEGARFTGETYFTGARFTGETCFAGAQFVGGAHFYGAQFYAGALEGARVSGPGLHQSVWPPGWTTRPGQPDKGEDPAFRYLVRGEDPAG